MINKIIDGISLQVADSFGDGYKIYTEQVKQGLKEPCFFIICVNPTNNQVLGNRYFRNNLFCVQYFPSSNEPKAECNSILDDLYHALEYITVDGKLIRGTKMHGELVDGVLNFFVNYDMFVYSVEKSTMMGALQRTITDVKG